MSLAYNADGLSKRWSAAEGLALIIGAQLVLWTLIPAVAFVTAPLDVIENIAWGQEWQLGYYKHPPLQAWLTGLAFQPAGAVWPVYLLSQLAMVACFLCIWALGRDVVDGKGRLFAVAFFSLIYYANIPTPEFNANVLQMPIWAAAPWLLWRALTPSSSSEAVGQQKNLTSSSEAVGQQKSQRLGWWIALGLVVALSVYSKYSAALLVPALAVAALSVPQGRAALRKPGLYIAAALAAVLVVPQMLWLIKHDFIPFAWAEGRSVQLGGLGRLTGTLKFLLAQFANHGGALLVLAVGAAGRVSRTTREDTLAPADRYVLVTAFAPIAIAVLASAFLGMGLRDMWAAPMFAYTGLAAAILLRPHFARLRWNAMIAVWAVLFVGAPIGAGLAPLLGVPFGAKPARVAFDGRELAQQAEALWRAKTGRELTIVAGLTWEAGVVTAYAPHHPAFFVDGEMLKNPWITPERLAAEGALVLWPVTDYGSAPPPPSLERLGPFAETGSFSIPYRYGNRLAKIAWAILPSANSRKGGAEK